LGLKGGVKRLGRPFTTRLYARTDARDEARLAALRDSVQPRLDALEARASELGAGVDALDRYLPVVMNTIATQNAHARQIERRLAATEHRAEDGLAGADQRDYLRAAQIEALAEAVARIERRIEFIRQEVMLEQRYADQAGGERAKGFEESVEARVVNTEKLEAMGDDIRLNVGAGHITMDEYLNVDARPLPGIDVVADVRDLPFEPGQVSEIYSAHLLEHFPAEELRRVVLPRWIELLRDGGKLVAVVPDIEAMATEYASGHYPFPDFVRVLYGDQEYEGDFHFAGYSPDTLVEMLEAVGLGDVKVREAGRRNGASFEMEVEATRHLAGAP
jgi:hypothetical protein